MSPELGGGRSLRNAKGVQGRSWQNSETALKQKTGHPLTSINAVVKAFFSVLKAEWHLSEKSQAEPLQVRWVSVRYWITNRSLTKSILLHPFSATPPSSQLCSISIPSLTLLHSSLFPTYFTLCPCLPVSLISIPMLL